MEPTKHQYDYDVADRAGFLVRTAWRGVQAQHRGEPRDARRAQLPARTAYAAAQACSADRRQPRRPRTAGTPTSSRTLSGPRRADARSCAAGGLGSGGLNFDAKLRRESIDRTTCSTPTSAAWTPSPGPRRRRHPQGRRAWRGHKDSDPRAGTPIRENDPGRAMLKPGGPGGAGRRRGVQPSPHIGGQEAQQNMMDPAIWSADRLRWMALVIGMEARRPRPRPFSSTRPALSRAIGVAEYGYDVPRRWWSEQGNFSASGGPAPTAGDPAGALARPPASPGPTIAAPSA